MFVDLLMNRLCTSELNSSFKSETRCPIEPSIGDQAMIVSVVGLILALFQLLMSVIGTIIALQIKPWKQVEVHYYTAEIWICSNRLVITVQSDKQLIYYYLRLR